MILNTGTIFNISSLPLHNDVSYMLCDGRELSRIDYAELFNVINIKFGDGDKQNTFNIPNLNELFIRGINLNNNNNNNLIGDIKEQEFIKHSHRATLLMGGAHRHYTRWNGWDWYQDGAWGSDIPIFRSDMTRETDFGGEHSHLVTLKETGGKAQPLCVDMFFGIVL